VKMVESATFKGSWPWPRIRSYRIPSCITYRPLHIRHTEIEETFLWTDVHSYVHTYVWMDIWDPLY